MTLIPMTEDHPQFHEMFQAVGVGDVAHGLQLAVGVDVGVGADLAAVGAAGLLLGAVDVRVPEVGVAEGVLDLVLVGQGRDDRLLHDDGGGSEDGSGSKAEAETETVGSDGTTDNGTTEGTGDGTNGTANGADGAKAEGKSSEKTGLGIGQSEEGGDDSDLECGKIEKVFVLMAQ